MNEERSEKPVSGKIDEKQVKDAQDKRELRQHHRSQMI